MQRAGHLQVLECGEEIAKKGLRESLSGTETLRVLERALNSWEIKPRHIMKVFVHVTLTMGIIALACQVCASGQVERKMTTASHAMATNATCYEEATRKLTGSHKSRTAVLTSPDGRYEAYAESEALASPAAESECQNTSKLFVAGPGRRDFREVLVIKPILGAHGNSIELVDWSPGGHRLLLAEGVWEWGSDSFENMTRIYDADSQTVSKDSLVERAFRKAVGRDCVAILRPVGFSESGSVVVGTGPYFAVGEDSPDKDSCVAKEELWLIDTKKSAASALPEEYKVRHYGKESLRVPGVHHSLPK